MQLTPKQKKIALAAAAVAAVVGIYFYTRKSTSGEGSADGATGGGLTDGGATDGATDGAAAGNANQLLASAQTAKRTNYNYQEELDTFRAAHEAAEAKRASAPPVPLGSGLLTVVADADGNLFYGGGRSVALKANTPVSIALPPQTIPLIVRYADGRPLEQKQATIVAGRTVNVYFGTSRPQPRVALRIMTPYGLRTIASEAAP